MAVDDAVSLQAPIAARLPNGAWALAWVSSLGGADSLRTAVVGKRGELIGPTTLATDTTILESRRATSTSDGVALMWRHDDATARVALTTCAVP